MLRGCNLHYVDYGKRVNSMNSHSYYTRRVKPPRLLQPLSARAVCGSKQAGGARRWRGEGITHTQGSLTLIALLRQPVPGHGYRSWRGYSGVG